MTPSGVALDRTAGVGDAHDTAVYADTGRLIDYSSDPSLQQWLEQQERFFSGPATVTRWHVTG